VGLLQLDIQIPDPEIALAPPSPALTQPSAIHSLSEQHAVGVA
jgi:hypothetical protein